MQGHVTVRMVYLFDGFSDGRHLTHLRNYAPQVQAQAMGCRVVELLPEPASVASWFTTNCPQAGERLRLLSYRYPQIASPRPWRLRRLIKPLCDWQEAGRAVRTAAQESGWWS